MCILLTQSSSRFLVTFSSDLFKYIAAYECDDYVMHVLGNSHK